jgi:hypothetical protein
MGGIMGLLGEVARDGKVAGAARSGDANKIRDGVMKRAREEMIDLAARVGVRGEEGEVEEATAEMFHSWYVTPFLFHFQVGYGVTDIVG